MTRSMLSRFATFAALTLLILQNLAAEPVREAKHLQVLLAMDTDAANISAAVRADLRLLSTVLNEVRAGHSEKMSITVFQGSDVTPANVLSHYASLHRKDDDSLLFIYSGHGGIDPIHGQFLAMRRGRLDRSDLRIAMDKTGAGLRVILTDCCSNIAGVDPPNRRIPAAWEGFKQLFFQHRGLVDITAASDQTFAWGSNKDGGYFVQCLARLFCEPIATADQNGDGFVLWDEFAEVLSGDTNTLFLKAQANASGDESDPNHISHFSSQIPKAYCTGYCKWEQASMHHQLRSALWEGEALWYGYATYKLLDPTQVQPNGAEARLRQATPYAARAGAFFTNAANHQSRAISYETKYPTGANVTTLARRKAELERQASSYNTVARGRRRSY